MQKVWALKKKIRIRKKVCVCGGGRRKWRDYHRWSAIILRLVEVRSIWYHKFCRIFWSGLQNKSYGALCRTPWFLGWVTRNNYSKHINHRPCKSKSWIIPFCFGLHLLSHIFCIYTNPSRKQSKLWHKPGADWIDTISTIISIIIIHVCFVNFTCLLLF